MQNIKKTLKSKRFWLGTVLPFALAVAAAFVARYQLEISDGVTANYMVGQWPVYAPLNALTAFCLTLVVFALCGSWGIATGISGLIFTVLALINYYTRDLHGSALMPQDILNLATHANDICYHQSQHASDSEVWLSWLTQEPHAPSFSEDSILHKIQALTGHPLQQSSYLLQMVRYSFPLTRVQLYL